MRQGYEAPTKAWVLKAYVTSSTSQNPSPTPRSPVADDDARAWVDDEEGGAASADDVDAVGCGGKAGSGRADDERRLLRGAWTVSSVLFSTKPSLPALLQAASPSHLRQLAQDGWHLGSATNSSATLGSRSTCELLREGERSVDQCIRDFAAAFSVWYDAHVCNGQREAELEQRLARLARLRGKIENQTADRDRHELSLGVLAKAALAAEVCRIMCHR